MVTVRESSSVSAEAYLGEMLGTFLRVSVTNAPGDYRLRDVAVAFNRWAMRQPVERLAMAYEQLLNGRLAPEWNELELRRSS